MANQGNQKGTPPTPARDPREQKNGGVEGEGSYTATHRYNEGLKKSIEAGKSDELAQQAKEALEGPEGEELRKAEEAGKRPAVKSDQKLN